MHVSVCVCVCVCVTACALRTTEKPKYILLRVLSHSPCSVCIPSHDQALTAVRWGYWLASSVIGFFWPATIIGAAWGAVAAVLFDAGEDRSHLAPWWVAIAVVYVTHNSYNSTQCYASQSTCEFEEEFCTCHNQIHRTEHLKGLNHP